MSDDVKESGIDIQFINRAQQFAMLDNMCIVPVTHWFDSRGEDCEPHKAVVCVAGSDEFGWYTVDLREFDYVMVH
jgi:hypothetical protein